MPARKGVNCKVTKCSSPLLILAQLGLVRMLDRTVTLFRGLLHQGLMDGVDHSDVEGSVTNLFAELLLLYNQ